MLSVYDLSSSRCFFHQFTPHTPRTSLPLFRPSLPSPVSLPVGLTKLMPTVLITVHSTIAHVSTRSSLPAEKTPLLSASEEMRKPISPRMSHSISQCESSSCIILRHLEYRRDRLAQRNICVAMQRDVMIGNNIKSFRSKSLFE